MILPDNQAEARIKQIFEQIRLRVEETIQEYITTHFPDVFIVELAHRPFPNEMLRILVDTDEGIRLEQCEAIHRRINDLLEDQYSDLDCSIEVSSPGVGRPLKLHRQYRKNTGRMLKVLTKEGIVSVGILRGVTDQDIELEVEFQAERSPKVQHKQIRIPWDQIKEARVEITF